MSRTQASLSLSFSRQAAVDTILEGTTSGGVAVNTVIEHFGNLALPFGGVGDSGMGRCLLPAPRAKPRVAKPRVPFLLSRVFRCFSFLLDHPLVGSSLE